MKFSPNRSLNMLDVWFANPFISFVMLEKNSLVAPLPIDVTDDFLSSDIELDDVGFVDGFIVLLMSSSKLACCWFDSLDSPNNPTYKINMY